MEQQTTPPTAGDTAQCDERVLLNELAIDDAAMALGLSPEATTKIKDFCRNIACGEVNAMTVKTFADGLSHDDDVKNADADGYLRGKNEKITLENRFDGSHNQHAARASVVPRYARRSIWDIDDI
ncbi:MAG: hypothetical protein ACI308_09475 [Muribaculaceae bacterium]